MEALKMTFPVIPGETYQSNTCRSISKVVLGFLPKHPLFPDVDLLSPAVVYRYTNDESSEVFFAALTVFQSMQLPLGQRIADTTELAIYKGGLA
jgi:hypothetical protein